MKMLQKQSILVSWHIIVMLILFPILGGCGQEETQQQEKEIKKMDVVKSVGYTKGKPESIINILGLTEREVLDIVGAPDAVKESNDYDKIYQYGNLIMAGYKTTEGVAVYFKNEVVVGLKWVYDGDANRPETYPLLVDKIPSILKTKEYTVKEEGIRYLKVFKWVLDNVDIQVAVITPSIRKYDPEKGFYFKEAEFAEYRIRILQAKILSEDGKSVGKVITEEQRNKIAKEFKKMTAYTVCPRCNGRGDVPCSRCGGSGEIEAECSACQGKGYSERYSGSPTRLTKTECVWCDGTGRRRVKCPKCRGFSPVCPMCNGIGQVKK